ncbi:MAG: DUF115 domain-containing protein [Candidatus Gastranaerophilales bacterium]|nr:DUF115 domain-containing protein [Candidatus Gastranaerophilales bacterium]
MLQKNLSALKKYSPKIADKIEQISIEDAAKNISVHQAKSGDLVIAKDGIALESLENPIENSKNVWDSIVKAPLTKNDFVIIYGLGLGYLLKRTYISCPSRIVVYEPFVEVLRFVLEYVDFSAVLSSGRVFFAEDANSVNDFVNDRFLTSDRVEVVYPEAYAARFSQEVIDFSTKIFETCTSKISDVNTIKRLSGKWVGNFIQNIKKLDGAVPLSCFRDKYQGKTAVILGAGPSLRTNFEYIKKNKDKFVIFAVNKVCDFLAEQNFIPDFMVVADAEFVEFSMRHYTNLTEKVNLIASPKVDSATYNLKYASKILFLLENDSISVDLKKHFDAISLSATAGTGVAQCYFAATEMGFKNLIFAGVDLAFKDGEIYAGRKVDLETESGNLNFKQDHPDKVYLSTKGLREIIAHNGQKVLTRDDYLVFINQLSSIFQQDKIHNLYNVTNFGANISGMKYLDFESVLSELNLKDDDGTIDVEFVVNQNQFLSKEIVQYWRELSENEKINITNQRDILADWVSKRFTLVNDISKSENFEQQLCLQIKNEELIIVKKLMSDLFLQEALQGYICSFSDLNAPKYDGDLNALKNARIKGMILFEQMLNMMNILLEKFL